MKRKLFAAVLALLTLLSVCLPAPLGAVREAAAAENIMLKSAYYKQETNAGCVLACCAMAFENVRHETITYKKSGKTYTGFQAVYQANGAKDSAQWGTLYKAFEIKEKTFIRTSEYGTRKAEDVEKLFLEKLKTNPNGILAYFRKSKTDDNGHCILIVGYKNGKFYVNDPARNLKDGKEIPITDSYVAKNLLKTTSQKTILGHIGFAEVYTDANPSKKLTITFNPNGGTVKDAEKTKTVTKNKTYGAMPTPTRDGYSFLGWFDAKSGGNQVTSSTKVVRSSNHSLFAHWEAAPADGLVLVDGVWKYYRNGVVDTAYEGFALGEGIGFFYVKNGEIDFSFTGIAYGEGIGHWYGKNGALDPTFTGVAYNRDFGLLYCENGYVNFTWNGTVTQDGKSYLVENSRAREMTVDPNKNGIYLDGSTWHYYRNGVINTAYEGFALGEGIGFFYVKNGQIDFSFTGSAYGEGIGYWYGKDGALNPYFTGVANSQDFGLLYCDQGYVNFVWNGTFTQNGVTYAIENSRARVLS